MAKGGGISGLALGMAAAGGLIVYFGIGNIPVLDGLRSILKGQLPPLKVGDATGVKKIADLVAAAQAPTAGVPGGSSISSNAIVAAAQKYMGVPYVWGGATPTGFDCSGLVTWVLHHDLGINLPDNTHTVTTQFLVWGGATTIPRAQAAAGDLCVTTSHIGIAVDNQKMINAPTFGKNVEIDPIQAGMVIRRLNYILTEQSSGASMPSSAPLGGGAGIGGTG